VFQDAQIGKEKWGRNAEDQECRKTWEGRINVRLSTRMEGWFSVLFGET
jgi:hypothetical protein